MKGRRSLLVACGLLAALVWVPRASAQDTECGDQGDREVRSLDFRGNRAFSDDQLAVRVRTTPSSWARRYLRFFGTRRCIDTLTLASDIVNLTRFYRLTGYFRARIDTIVTPAGPDQINVIFNIDEGQPVPIAEATITGLDSVKQKNQILSNLYLKVGRPFDQLRIQADYDSIVARLRNAGYPKADILRNQRTDTVAYAAYVEPVVITGPYAKFDGVRIDVTPVDGRGQQISNKIVNQLLGIDSGDVYRTRDIDEAQRNLYRTAAYRHVEVTVDSLQPQGDSLVTLHVMLVEDLMRQLDTELGYATLDCFRTRAVYTNKNFWRARRLELTGQLTKIGFGAPLDANFIRQSPLCHQLTNDPFSQTLNYFGGATIRQPALFGTNAVPALSVYSERRGEYLAWLRTTAIGADLSLTKNIGIRTTPVRMAYTFEYGRTEAQDALLCAIFRRCDQDSRALLLQNQPLGVASVVASRVRTDNEVFPTRGTIFRAEARSSASFLGSNKQLTFNKGVIDGLWYLPLGFGSTFAVRLRGGVVYGGAGTDSSGARLPPPQERLYAGGATSVRGFQQNELGEAVYILKTNNFSHFDTLAAHTGPPVEGDTVYYYTNRDSADFQRVVPVGGNAMVVANFEFRLRSPFLSDLLQYAVFADAGEVWTRGLKDQGLGFKTLKWTPGVGLRLFSPIGPIQVNVGYNPYARPNGSLFYDAPIDSRTGFAPLYCVSPVSNPKDPNVIKAEALPVIYRHVSVQKKDVGVQPDQVHDKACPTTFFPAPARGFLRHLTLTFSIGPDF
jgi:outer membrane protein insertion porin family